MPPSSSEPRPAQIRRWRRYLADERTEAAVYRDLAHRRTGAEREILLALAQAESRHEAHWLVLLGEHARASHKPDLKTRVLGFFARRFGSIFVLALAQQSEGRSPYERDSDATQTMAADERIHAEVVRGLAARGRARLSGTFRAAVFGANDGLVSNLALVIGMAATGVGTPVILAAGVAGLLAGALSMAAGEYVSVRSQLELLEASTPDPSARAAVPYLDVDANELALVYRARGMSEQDAASRARDVFSRHGESSPMTGSLAVTEGRETIGTAWRAAVSSFAFFASGAVIPVLPYIVGLSGAVAVIIAAVAVGLALLATGAVVGVLSGASPLRRALRQLGIGYGAAAVTYALGLLFGTTLG